MIKRILSAFGLLLLLAGCATTGVVAPSGMSWELTTEPGDLMLKHESHRCHPTPLALSEAAKLKAEPLLIDPAKHCTVDDKGVSTHRVSDAVFLDKTLRLMLPGMASSTIQVVGGYQIGKAVSKNCGKNCEADSFSSNTTVNVTAPACGANCAGTGTAAP